MEGGQNHLFVWGSGMGADGPFSTWRKWVPNAIFMMTETELWNPYKDVVEPSFTRYKDILVPGRLTVDDMISLGKLARPMDERDNLGHFIGWPRPPHPSVLPPETCQDSSCSLNVRSVLLALKEKEPLFHVDVDVPYVESFIGLTSSLFCFVPRGKSAWSSRFFQTFFAGCIPVLLNDRYDPPFGEFVDLPSAVIKWPMTQVPALVDYLKQLAFEDAERMSHLLEAGKALKCWYAWPPSWIEWSWLELNKSKFNATCEVAPAAGFIGVRINQARFFLLAEDARRVAWRLQEGTRVSIHSSASCLDDDFIVDAEAVPWVDRDDPIQHSSLDIFIDPARSLARLSRQKSGYVCIGGMLPKMQPAPQKSCLCELELSLQTRGNWFLLYITRPLHRFTSVAEVLVALERRCPAAWIPDTLALVLVTLVLGWLVVVVESCWAAWREPREEPCEQGSQNEDVAVVVSASISTLKSGFTSALGFVAAIISIQTLAVAKVVTSSTPEELVWLLIGLAFALSMLGVYRIFQVLCKVQLLQASLARRVWIQQPPMSSWYDAALLVGVALYTGLVVCLIMSSAVSIAAAVGAGMLVISAMMSPIMSLLKVMQSTVQMETDSTHLKMEPGGLTEKQTTAKQPEGSIRVEGWAFSSWSDLVQAGREGRDLSARQPWSQAEEPGRSQKELSFLRDLTWQRAAVKRLAGSYAGFLVLPSFVAAMALAIGATGVHMSMYACSVGELDGLQLAGMSQVLAHMPSQDRYTLALDASFKQVVLQANGTDYLAREIRIHPGQEVGSSSASALVELHNMAIPRIAEVEVFGLRPSLPGSIYSVRFAPKQMLPQKLLITDKKGAILHCFAFSALPGSQLSIPIDVSKLRVAFLFADYTVGIPLEHGQGAGNGFEWTWTEFAPATNSSCKSRCLGSPHCLYAYRGHVGCFFAHHDYELHEQRCEMPEKDQLQSHGPFAASLRGCTSSQEGSACGPQVSVQQHSAHFGLVEPAWRGEVMANLEFSLVMQGSWQDLPIVRQDIALRRGRPQVTDVLVSLTAITRKNDRIEILAFGRVGETGDITLQISEYNVTNLSSLELVIVPIVPDRNFQVRFLQQEAGTVNAAPELLPHFRQCQESEILLQRYQACQKDGGTGDWNATFLRRTLSPVFGDAEITFVVELKSETMSPESRDRHWGSMENHKVKAEFSDVDSPLAWAAKHLGCDLFSNKLRHQLDTDVFTSTDATCIALQACRKSQKQCPALVSRVGFVVSPNVLKVMACLQKWCDASLPVRAWDYNAGILTPPIFAHSDVNLKHYSLTEWFAEAVRLEAQHLPGLEQIRKIAQQVFNTTDPPDVEWLQLALSTGSLELVREVVRSLEPRFGESTRSVMNHKLLARAAWEATSQHEDDPSWCVTWLTGLGEFGRNLSYSEAEWIETLARVGIEDRYTTNAQVMGDFLSNFAPALSAVSALRLHLHSTAALGDAAQVVAHMPGLERLYLFSSNRRFARHFQWHVGFNQAFIHLKVLSLHGWVLGAAELKAMAGVLTQELDFVEISGPSDTDTHEKDRVRLDMPGAGATEPPFRAEHFRLLMPVCVHRLQMAGVLETASDARTVAADIRNTSMPCLQMFCSECRAV
ncbi:rib-1 [Symbiodinium sp. KB8]|nr:rib-1 [Symbiodinium sp. KB8]